MADRYYSQYIEEKTPPKLKIYSIDIEVDAPEFPNPSQAKWPITCITVTDFSNKKSYTFGLRPFSKKIEYEYRFFHCKDEGKLLKAFISWWHKNIPDVITGWNINADYKVNLTGGFDLPYIINRCSVLFGEKNYLYKKLSPINIVNVHNRQNEDTQIVDIAGISVIDYMALYKWYTHHNLESYSLETVCQHELGEGKLEYENDLGDLYKNDWDKYVEYNIKDTQLILQLEEKLKYLKLAQSLSLLCKCQMKMYSSTTNLVEGLLLTRFRQNKQCAPYFAGGNQQKYKAAYVKEPIPNKYNWLFSLDISSSYPHSIIVCNMSPETVYGKITDMSEQDIMKHAINKDFPRMKIIKDGEIKQLYEKEVKIFNNALKKRIICVTPNGVVFYNNPKGVYANMERDVYLKRKQVKKEMNKKYKEYEKTKDEKTKFEAESLYAYQYALKIVINGAYGALAVPYSRYFQPWIAEAITYTSRWSLMQGEKYVNELLNEPNDELESILLEISK